MAVLEVEPVTDLDHPELKAYRSLRRRNDLERQSRFVVEGDKVVQRFLTSSYPVESLLITQEWLDRIRDLLDARADRIRVFVGSKARIEEVTGFGCYQAIKAVGRITHPITFDDLLTRSARPRLLVALDGICNAENMGVIVRNAAALGVQGLIVGPTSCSPFLTRAIRTSMGNIFHLPAVENIDLVEACKRLGEAGTSCLAAHPSTREGRLDLTSLRGDCCLVLGSEGYGISPEVLSVCTARIAVPMANQVDSLNVSSAAAVLFYEAWRQRTGADSPATP